MEADSGRELAKTLYFEMRKLAAAKMNREYSPQTLQATALVHEAWLRVGGDQQPRWANRSQYFAAVAEAMRRILVDRARSKRALIHGGGKPRESLDVIEFEKLEIAKSPRELEQILAVDEAIERLARDDPESARLLELRYFAGRSTQEVAEIMGLAQRTAERRIAFAKAWIKREIGRAHV